jgi:RNA polymerase sigma-70 factor (ECF subfamily)
VPEEPGGLIERGLMDDGSEERRARFATLYADHRVALLGYARRRTDQPDSAADVVAETFTVAWRRLEAVPPDPEARLWLYGVAHRVLANHDRGRDRRHRLGLRLAATIAHHPVADHADAVGSASLVRDALALLPPDDRDLLHLTAWEELTSPQIAVVLDVPPATVRTRLHRARGRLRDVLRQLGHDGEPDQPVVADPRGRP